MQVGLVATNNQPPTAGQAFNGQVATFAALDVQGTLSDFQATINWGGGLTPITLGTIAPNSQGGYSVFGSNVYTVGTTYTVSVNVTGARTEAPPRASGWRLYRMQNSRPRRSPLIPR